jgi:hypothetical protein
MAEERFWVEAIPYGAAVEEGQVVGYMRHRRIKVGEKFQVTDKEFSKKWMQRIPEIKAKHAQEEEQDTKADKRRRKIETEESVI